MTSRKEFAIQMQVQIAKEGCWPECDPRMYIRSARWHYWHSKYSASPSECLMVAKSQYRLARDMQADPAYYTRRPGGMSCWLWFQKRTGEAPA